jgi:hypothetical protein
MWAEGGISLRSVVFFTTALTLESSHLCVPRATALPSLWLPVNEAGHQLLHRPTQLYPQ